jgi:hypothetical protein
MADENTVDMDKILTEAVEEVGSEAKEAKDAPAVQAEAAEPKADKPKEDKPKGKDSEDNPSSEGSPSDKGDAIDDALVERAVKAGMSVADIKAFSSREAAERVVSLLEQKTDEAATETKGEEEEKGAEVPALDLSEFTEDNGYDPATVKVLNSMKSLLDAQAKELESLKKAGESAREHSFFDLQFNGLDEAVRSHVDAVAKSRLEAKFKALEAGYKAVKADVKREDVFREAVNLALGDLVRKAEAEGKSAAVEKRRLLALARPGGERGARNAEGGKAMTEEDVADALFDKLTK